MGQPVSFSSSSGTGLCVIPVVQSNFGELQDQMLHVGHKEVTDCFRSFFQTNGMGEAEPQKSSGAAKGKEERKLPGWRSHHRVGARRRQSSCWLADGEHLQHKALPKMGQAAASSKVYRKSCMY